MQSDDEPEAWRRLLALADEAAGQGANLVPQVAARPFGMLAGHQSRVNPFADAADLSRARALAARRADRSPPRARGARPHPRRAIGGRPGAGNARGAARGRRCMRACSRSAIRRTTSRRRRERRGRSRRARASRRRRQCSTTSCSRHDGRELLFFPILNYAGCTAEPIREMILHPRSGARPRRRRRPLRHRLRRQHDDVHADALGTRSASRVRASRSRPRSGRSRTIPPRSTVSTIAVSSGPGLEGGPEPDRPRPPPAPSSRDGLRSAEPAPGGVVQRADRLRGDARERPRSSCARVRRPAASRVA